MTPMPIYKFVLERGRKVPLAFRSQTTVGRKMAQDDLASLYLDSCIKLNAGSIVSVYESKLERPHARTGERQMDFGPDDYPMCIPPWNRTWVEFSIAGAHWGVTCNLVNIKCEEAQHMLGTIRARGLFKGFDFQDKYDEIEWLVLLRPMQLFDLAIYSLDYWYVVGIDKSGLVVSQTALGGWDIDKHDERFFLLEIPLLAFCFANCKNIVSRDIEAGCRRDSNPDQKFSYKYRILKISGSFTGSHESAGGKVDKAMHICRGNFARYADDKPLFGKYTGLFWRPMHVRGNAKNGVVDKDYELQPRQQDSAAELLA